jgi:UTP:GlnB (protein PII) uridylyltransferase
MIGALYYMLPELLQLKNLTQSPPHVFDVWEHTLDTVNKLESLLHVLGPNHDPEASANLTLGLVAFRLGRYRQKLSSHLSTRPADDRSLRALLFLAALYHDAGKSQTWELDDHGKIRYYNHAQEGLLLVADRAKALHLSNNEIGRLKIIVGHHMRPLFMAQKGKSPTRRSVYRFFRDVGDAGIEIGLLSLVDVLATYGPTLPQDKWAHQVDVVRRLYESFWERYEEQVDPPKLITGDDLLREFGLEPGPLVGELLDMVKEAQAVGTIRSREEALSLVRMNLD